MLIGMVKKLLCLLVPACFICLAGLLLGGTVVYADNTTYYINNQTGSNNNDGTSESTPWADFTNVNNMTFGPGDKILLARGCTWNQELKINGSGSASNWAELGAYGTGPRPRIIRNGNTADRCVRMINPSYWKISDLEVGYAGTGILVYYTEKFNHGLHFNNILVHHNVGIEVQNTPDAVADNIWNSAGICITAQYGLTYNGNTEYLLKDLRMDNIEGHDNLNSVAIAFKNTINTAGNSAPRAVRDVILNNLYFHDDDNGGANGSNEGMMFRDVTGGTIMNSIFDQECGSYSSTGTATIYFATSQNVTFVNNIILNTPKTINTANGKVSPDLTGIDFEANTDSFRVFNNFFGWNKGPGLEFLNLTQPSVGDFCTNHVVAGNAFANNGIASIKHVSWYGVRPQNVTIRDNLYYELDSFLTSPYPESFTLTNNNTVDSVEKLNYAALRFSGIQGANNWSYQYYNGSTWSDLAYYDSTAKAWKKSQDSAAPMVKPFEQLPEANSNCAVARVWTAPYSGTVNIRGRVLKSDIGGGDGITAEITKNGFTIWGPRNVSFDDITGYETNINNLTVEAGDVIRFVVKSGAAGNNSNDMTSWVPMIAYMDTSDTEGLYEVEDLKATESANDFRRTVEDASAGGSFRDDLEANAVNDYIQYTLNTTRTGTFNVRVGVRKNLNYGKFKLYINGTLQGAEQDLYSPSAIYTELDLGQVSFSSTGSKQFKFAVTGKNASSSGYWLGIDYIRLESVGSGSMYTLVSDNFNNQAAGSQPSGWDITNDADTSCQIANVPDSNDRSMKLYDNNTAGLVQARKVFTPQTGIIEAEWKFNVTRDDSWSRFYLYGGSTAAINMCLTASNYKGLTYIDSEGAVQQVQLLEADRWYTLKLVIDVAAKTYDIYVDNILKKEGASFADTGVGSIDSMVVKTGNGPAAYSLYIDNVYIRGENAPAPVTLLYENFNSHTAGSQPPGWDITNDANTSCTVANVPSDTDKSMRLYDNSSSGYTRAKKTFAALTGTFTAEWRFNEGKNDSWGKFYLYSGDTPVIQMVLTGTDYKGLTYIDSEGVVQQVQLLDANQWYTMRIDVNVSAKSYDIYVDGILKVSGATFTNTSMPDIDGIFFATGGGPSGYSLYIDDVKITY